MSLAIALTFIPQRCSPLAPCRKDKHALLEQGKFGVLSALNKKTRIRGFAPYSGFLKQSGSSLPIDRYRFL